MMNRFCAYIDKMFSFGRMAAAMEDSREAPRIGAPAVWTSIVFMCVTGLRSLNRLGQQTRLTSRWRKLVGRGGLASPDTIGRVAGLMGLGPIRAAILRLCYLLKRAKILQSPWPLTFAAVDGHEFFSLTQALLPGLPPAHGPGGRA